MTPAATDPSFLLRPYVARLALLVGLWMLPFGWLGWDLYARGDLARQTDQADLREWLDETRVFRKTLPDLVREYAAAAPDPARFRAKHDELSAHLAAMAEPTRKYAGKLPLFPDVYTIAVFVPGHAPPPGRDAHPGWASPLPRPGADAKERVRVLEYPVGGGAAVIRCEYRVHSNNRFEQEQKDRRSLQLAAVGLMLAAGGTAVVLVARFLGRKRRQLANERERDRELTEARVRAADARAEAEHREREVAEAQARAAEAKAAVERQEREMTEIKSRAAEERARAEAEQREREVAEARAKAAEEQRERELAVAKAQAAEERAEAERRAAEAKAAAEMRAAEAERAALELKSQLYANIGVMAASYAHNIKNLLVRPNDLLVRCAEADGMTREQHGMLQEVRSSLGTVTERLQQILRTVRRDPSRAEMTPLDLGDLVREAARTWAETARDKWKVVLSAEVAPGPLPVSGDLSHLQQAIENLITNARDATFEMRNHLREEARAAPGLDPAARRQRLIDAAAWKGEVRLRATADGDAAVLEVRDNGVGMTEEVRAKCLTTHFTTKRDNALYEGYSAGMGLGLSFVAVVLDHHRATLEIDSAPLKGATFRVRLPLAEEGS